MFNPLNFIFGKVDPGLVRDHLADVDADLEREERAKRRKKRMKAYRKKIGEIASDPEAKGLVDDLKSLFGL